MTRWLPPTPEQDPPVRAPTRHVGRATVLSLVGAALTIHLQMTPIATIGYLFLTVTFGLVWLGRKARNHLGIDDREFRGR